METLLEERIPFLFSIHYMVMVYAIEIASIMCDKIHDYLLRVFLTSRVCSGFLHEKKGISGKWRTCADV